MASRFLCTVAVIISLCSCVGVSAAPPAAAEPAPQPGFSLTIYSTADPATFDPQEFAQQQVMNSYYALQNPLRGYGVVRENRSIPLDKGDNTIRFTDVATGIDPTTVSFQSLTAPAGASVLEQN